MDIGFGIDGGGTRSRLVLFEPGSLKVLHRGEGGPTNPHSTGMAGAQDNLRQLLQAGCQALQITLADLACGCLGSAGLGRPLEQAVFFSFLQELTKAPLHVCSDGEILLVGSTGSLSGYCLIAGTGSFALGRDRAGLVVRAGGLGHMLGDEGSASWMGWQAMRRALRSLEQRDLATGMLPDLLAHYRLQAPEEAIPLFHQGFDKARVAASAPLVLAAAKAGDALAQDILAQAAKELFAQIQSVAARLPLEEMHIALAGGLLERDSMMRAALIKQLAARYPLTRISIAGPGDAVMGACILANGLVKRCG